MEGGRRGETCFSRAFRSYELTLSAGAWDGSADCSTSFPVSHGAESAGGSGGALGLVFGRD